MVLDKINIPSPTSGDVDREEPGPILPGHRTRDKQNSRIMYGTSI